MKNDGRFKSQGRYVSKNCVICNKEFKYYLSKPDRKHCSRNCYYNSRIGVKRPIHSEFMKNSPRNFNLTFAGKTHTQSECKNISKRMKMRWKDKNDYVNSETFKQIISDRNISLIKTGKGISEFNRGYSRGNAGWYIINDRKFHFRSSWEVNYARYLEWLVYKKQIIKWDYEKDTFWFETIKRGVRSYLPDFKLFNNDGSIEYHEVKGYMDDKSKTKIKRMAKYYPETKLIVIGGDEYKSIFKYERMFPEASKLE
jgi:hypothetical protein